MCGRELTRYMLTASGRVALLHDGVGARIQRVLGESEALSVPLLAKRVCALRETVRRRVSAMLRAGHLRRLV